MGENDAIFERRGNFLSVFLFKCKYAGELLIGLWLKPLCTLSLLIAQLPYTELLRRGLQAFQLMNSISRSNSHCWVSCNKLITRRCYFDLHLDIYIYIYKEIIYVACWKLSTHSINIFIICYYHKHFFYFQYLVASKIKSHILSLPTPISTSSTS